MPGNEANEDREFGAAVEDAKRAKRLTNAALGVGIGSIFHPLQFSKVLIQLGYEPFPLQKGRAWVFFGGEKRFLPNGFVYARRIYQSYGLSSIYRGVGASICGNFVGAVASMVAEERISKYYGWNDEEENAASATDSKKFVQKVIKGSLSKVAGIVVARPFQVVMVRMIAQHIGGEEYYSGVFGSLKQIFKDEGLPGLYSGLIPQIACELCIYWTVSSVTYLLEYLWKSYVEREERREDEDEEPLESSPPDAVKSAFKFVVPYAANSIFYPLQLVSTIMAVNGAPVVAGMPPFIPVYTPWQDCFHDFAAKDQLKRGAKMFFRFYEKPITYRYGDIYALPNA